MSRLRNLFELWGVTGLVIFSVWLLVPGVSWGLLGVLWAMGTIGQVAAIALVVVALAGIVGWIVVEGIAYAREYWRRFRNWRLGIEEGAEAYEPTRPSVVIGRWRTNWARVIMRHRPRFFRRV